MNKAALTTASVFFFFGWARFTGTGFFAVEKTGRMKEMGRAMS